MVAPEPGEPLLLYIAATSEAMSMVLVAKWPDPHGLHELGSSSADGLGSQDPGPVEEPGANPAAGSQSPKAVTGPPDQTVTGSRTSELPPGAEGPDRPTSSVLHQRGPPRSQDEVPGGPQAALCSPHHLQEAICLHQRGL
jgi:hypothetical protein